MAVDKNFVVKNGLEVKSNLIVADSSLDSVGIGTSYIKEKLHVIGGVGATTLYVGGIGTVHVAVGNTARYDNISISGISTASEVTVLGITSTKNLTVSGVSTFQTGFTTNLTTQSLSVTGVSTFAGAIADATITSLKAPTGVSTNFTATNLRVTGISTLTGNVTVGTGITMYASAGIVSATELFAEGIKVATAVTATSFTGNLTGDVTGNADTVTVTVDNTTNTTHYPLFVGAASGDLAGETDSGLTYNPSSGYLTATRFIGLLQGNAATADEATTATNVTVTANNSTDETVYPIFVDGATGAQGAESDTGLNYNPSTGNLTATTFTGDLSGSVDTATNATNVNVTANNSTDETVYPIFVDGATGNQGAESDTGLTYNPSTGTLTSTLFSGNVNITANNSANETVYPTFVDGATGSQGLESDTGLNYNPNTGNLTAGKFTGDGSGLTDLSLGGEFSWIKNQTGISTVSNVGVGTTSAYNALTVVGNASVSGVATVSGVVTVGGLKLGDGEIAKFGASSDLQISHENSGHTSRIKAWADRAIDICYNETSSGLNKSFIQCYPTTGSVSLNHTSSLKLRTTTVGVNVTGNVDCDSFNNAGISTLTGAVTASGGITGNLTGAVDLNGGVLTLDADADTTITADTDDQIDIAFGGSDRITLSTGLIDLKNSGSKSAVRLYCESSNAHYTAIEAAAHSAYSGNATVTLPASTDTLVGRDTTDTLTNKTLTSPTITGTGSIAGTFTGNVTGTATEATNVTASANNSTNETVYPTFVDGTTGTQGIETDSGLTYNPSTGVLTTTSVTGNLTGNVTGNTSGSSGSCTGNAATATEATNVTASANNSTNETVYPTFVDGTTGTQGIETDSGLTYNPSTGVLTTTSVTGNLTGNVTGNCTGSSGSCTGNAATADAVDVSSITTNATYYPVFTDNNGSGKTIGLDTNLTYNPSSNVLTATTFSGNVTGNCTGSSGSCTGNSATATTATNVTAADESSDTTCFPLFVTAATGNLPPKTGSNLAFNSSTGALTATSFAGDGSALTGLSAGGSGEFNTSISGATAYAVTTSMATAYTANASTSHRTVVHSIHVTNISAAEVTVSGEMQSSFSFAQTIPIPAGSAVELLKQPKILGPSETIELQASSNSALQASIIVEYKEDTDLWDAQVDVTSAATLTDLYTSSSNPSVVQSILLANDSGTNDVKARVAWTDGSNNIQAYLCYDLVVPADSTIELCEKPKYLASGYKLRVYANVADRLEVTSSGKQIT